jgi:hypothetical protein
MVASTAVHRVRLRLGGWLAVLGGAGYVVAGAIHQDLPSGADAALAHVADRPEWYAIHLLVIVSVAAWPVAFHAAASHLDTARGVVVGRLAVGAVSVGLALYVLEMALDGFVLKQVADEWAAASGPAKEAVFERGATVYAVLGGVFRVSLLWVLGLSFLLLGIAIASSRTFPRWFGWIGAALGAVVTAYTATSFLALDVLHELLGFVVPGFLLALWTIWLGALLVRRARSVPGRS